MRIHQKSLSFFPMSEGLHLMFRPKRVGIIMTLACNAECRHCCFNCSSETTETMSMDKLGSLIGQIAEEGYIREIGLTGGEVFLSPRNVIEAVKIGKIKGLRVVCNTNGFWGKNPVEARKIIKALKDEKLDLLSLSYDRFHAEYVPIDSIINIIGISKEYGLDIEIKTIKTGDFTESIKCLVEPDIDIAEVPLSEEVCMKWGRAKYLDQKEIIDEISMDVHCSSLGRDILIYPDGFISPCCSPEARNISFGNIYSQSLTSVLDNLVRSKWFEHRFKYGIYGKKQRRVFNVSNACNICMGQFE